MVISAHKMLPAYSQATRGPVLLAALARLTDVLSHAITTGSGPPRPPATRISWTLTPAPVVDPRTAFFAPWTSVPADQAPGRVSAELIAAYPSGVPILAPGELITPGLLGALRQQAAEGSPIAYAADPTLRTLRVLADSRASPRAGAPRPWRAGR